MTTATLTTRQPGEWRPGLTNGPTYCTVGQHFLAAGERVWRYWTSPTVASHCACAECAGDDTEEEW